MNQNSVTNCGSNRSTPSQPHLLFVLCNLQKVKRFILASLLYLPTSLLALLLLVLLAYNGVSVFYVRVPFPVKTPSERASFYPENATGEAPRKWVSSKPSFSSSVMLAVKEEDPLLILKSHLPLLNKSLYSVLPMNDSLIGKHRRLRNHKRVFKILRSGASSSQFSARVKEFFGGNSSDSSCKVRFFMTWISSLESFGKRELLTIESLFKSHPSACLIIVSDSMDSSRGTQLLSPFMNQGFRVIAISPDFDYIFKNTNAEAWFNRLKKGHVDPGEVSLGQNLSNLLRLALLYKFGGIYIDTDVIVLKSLSNLRNSIGAQTIDLQTGNWSRLNNAVMIFDKKHPLLFKFIEEFALTFDGNKWGHNGPYLVSRVVLRVNGRPGFDFTVLPPPAFYPVDWSRIHSLFLGPRDENNFKWLLAKLRYIRRHSFAVHLWNRQSRRLKVEEGSIISHIISDCCVLCNSSLSVL